MKPAMIRILSALALLAVLALGLPAGVQASAPTPTITIIAVNPGVSVTIRANNFPGGQLFAVRMDHYGNLALNGTYVDTTNTGGGGAFEETYKIPDALQNDHLIAIRMDSSAGFFAYNWFVNQSSTSPTPTPVVPVTGAKPLISITSVAQNQSVTVRGDNFPANTSYTVRVGPYYTFFRDYVTTGTVNSGSGGTIQFTVQLPSVVKDVALVTVRLDGGGKFAYNAFKNVTGGSTTSPTSVPAGTCTVLSFSPAGSVSPNADFDAVVEVKNTTGTAWDKHSVDYKFVSGASLHKKARYDFTQAVSAGSSLKLIVDMRAPAAKGTYTESWAVVNSGTTYCTFNVTVTVK